MKTVTVEMEGKLEDLWNGLPPQSQRLLTSKALSAILKGDLYPTGTEQLELAIDLAEAGVDAEIISKLTRLDKSLFESFLS